MACRSGVESNTTRNKRIVKNTLYMYVRMFVMLVVSLFTARIVFNALGVDDYGTYNVVGSVIVFFSFLNGGLSSATKRYITAEISEGTEQTVRNVFNTCVVAHALIAGIVLLLAETVGLWCINDVLNIPVNRMTAANFVYQFSVLTAVFSIMQSPFSSAIVAFERMDVYAFFTIIEAVCKLGVAYFIIVLPGDRMINYGILLFSVAILIMAAYGFYCYRHFSICKWKKPQDKNLLKQIFSFTSWSLLGQASIVGTNQGVTVLVNYFFNVAVNAAMGVSNSIVNVVSGFVTNFQTAFNPQIIKSYVSQDWQYLQSLILRSSKISSFLILIFLVPMYFEIDKVLLIWLGSYPQYTVEFCRWTLLSLYLDTVTGPLWMTINAQTDIKRYQIATLFTYGANFLLSWLFLLLGNFPPYIVIIIRTTIFAILMFVRLVFTKHFFKGLNIKQWLDVTMFRPALISFFAFVVLAFFVNHVTINSQILHILFVTTISLLCMISGFFFFVFNKSERNFLTNTIKNIC